MLNITDANARINAVQAHLDSLFAMRTACADDRYVVRTVNARIKTGTMALATAKAERDTIAVPQPVKPSKRANVRLSEWRASDAALEAPSKTQLKRINMAYAMTDLRPFATMDELVAVFPTAGEASDEFQRMPGDVKKAVNIALKAARKNR